MTWKTPEAGLQRRADHDGQDSAAAVKAYRRVLSITCKALSDSFDKGIDSAVVQSSSITDFVLGGLNAGSMSKGSACIVETQSMIEAVRVRMCFFLLALRFRLPWAFIPLTHPDPRHAGNRLSTRLRCRPTHSIYFIIIKGEGAQLSRHETKHGESSSGAAKRRQ